MQGLEVGVKFCEMIEDPINEQDDNKIFLHNFSDIRPAQSRKSAPGEFLKVNFLGTRQISIAPVLYVLFRSIRTHRKIRSG